MNSTDFCLMISILHITKPPIKISIIKFHHSLLASVKLFCLMSWLVSSFSQQMIQLSPVSSSFHIFEVLIKGFVRDIFKISSTGASHHCYRGMWTPLYLDSKLSLQWRVHWLVLLPLDRLVLTSLGRLGSSIIHNPKSL